jgi:hypothetical protein
VVERHVVERHVAERHVVERHVVERHVVERHVVETYGRGKRRRLVSILVATLVRKVCQNGDGLV